MYITKENAVGVNVQSCTRIQEINSTIQTEYAKEDWEMGLVDSKYQHQYQHLFNKTNAVIRSDQIRSVAQSCPTLCDPMNHSTPGLPVQHQLPEFTETHVHRVSDAIQPSHPLSSPSPPAPNPSQHQSLFQ